MFNRCKKFIAFFLCAALLNSCILPSAALFAIKSPIIKKQSDPVPASLKKADTTETSNTENVTLHDTWQKLKNFEWNTLTKADAWNIAKVAGGTALSIAVAYALFKSTANNEFNINFNQPKTNDNPNAIPIPLENKKMIKQEPTDITSTNKTILTMDDLDKKENPTTTSSSTKEEEKPKLLYSPAKESKKQMVPVVQQRGSSCGYHSMLNSILSILDIDKHQANNIINTKFALKDGEWRAFIIQNRKKALIKNYIKNILHKCVALAKEEQDAWHRTKTEWEATSYIQRMLYSSPKKPTRKLHNDEREALNNISKAYADAYLLDENLNLLQENIENIPTQLINMLVKHCPQIHGLCHAEHDTQQTYLDNCQNVIQIINFNELATEIAHANMLIEQALAYAKETNALPQEHTSKTSLSTDLYGDDLDTNEMETLKALALQEYHIDHDTITIIDDITLINTDAYQDIFTPVKEQMLVPNCTHSFAFRPSNNNNYNPQEVSQLTQTIKKATDIIKATTDEITDLQAILDSTTNDNREQTAIMLQEKETILAHYQKEKEIAEKRQTTINNSLAANGASTHWISVTLDKKNGQNSYIIKDSMNGDYTNHPQVLQLINALEQPDEFNRAI